MALFVKSIVRNARKIFGKNKAGINNKSSSTQADNEIDRESIAETIASSVVEQKELQVPVDILAVTKDEQSVADDVHDGVCDDDLEKAVPPTFADDESFANELAEFECRLMTMEVPKDSFEEDFDNEEILTVRSEIEEDTRDLTKSRLWHRVEAKMLLEEVRYSIAAAAEDADEREAFEAALMSMDVPSDRFEEEFDESDDVHNVHSEIESDIRHINMLEEQLCIDAMMQMEAIRSSF